MLGIKQILRFLDTTTATTTTPTTTNTITITKEITNQENDHPVISKTKALQDAWHKTDTTVS